jgi:cobalt-zinc-cadmium efflux system protein
MFERISKQLFLPNVKSITKEKALTISIIITLVVMFLEIVFSFISHSLMLFSDGIHMLTHALSLIITLLSIIISKKTKNKSVELVAVTINGLTLFYFGAYIFIESFERLSNPEVIDLSYTLLIAFIGLIVNVFTALLLNQTGIEDLNTKSAFAHMIADTLMSVSILVGAVLIYFTGWYIIDAILSIVVSLLVMKWAFDLLRQIARVLREYTPMPFFYEENSENNG